MTRPAFMTFNEWSPATMTTEYEWLWTDDPHVVYRAFQWSPRKDLLAALAIQRQLMEGQGLQADSPEVRKVNRYMREADDEDREERENKISVLRGLISYQGLRKHEPMFCRTMRAVSGNPFSPVKLPREAGPCLADIAQEAYDTVDVLTGRMDRGVLLVLSDALEDELFVSRQCSLCKGKGAILGGGVECLWCQGKGFAPHPMVKWLRGEGPHFRGDWAVDLLLGKK